MAWFRDLLIVIGLSAAGRLLLFSGFIGGDDFAYAWAAHQILSDGYPVIGGNVFATRPLLIGPMAAGVAVLGWTELAIVLPVLLASLWGIGCAYALARLIAGRAAGLAAAATLAVFPLDLVYATTTTNDIVGSAVFGTAALLGWATVSASVDGRRRAALISAAACGLVAGLAPLVKVSMVLGWIPLALIMAVVVTRRRQTAPAAAMVAGWAIAQAAIAAFFWHAAGAPFENYSVELGFNRAFMAEPYLATRAEALWTYPSWALGLRPAVSDVGHFFPYGLFFPLVAVSSAACLWWRAPVTWFPVAWAAGILVLLEFWPLQLAPYIPIHRLPRFLHLAAVPGALIVGVACVHAWRRRGLLRVAAAAAWIAYAAHGLASSVRAAERHHDSMKDMRFAAAISARFDGPIVTDSEMRGYLLFRRGFGAQHPLHKTAGAIARVPPGSMVIVGGGRRIDMDPDWVENRSPDEVPDTWVKIADLPGERRPWRRSQGAVYIAPVRSTAVSKGATLVIGSAGCPAREWRLVDTIDVGDTASEAAHRYTIESPLFAGDLVKFDESGRELEEDGRSFRGSQAFDVSGLRPGVPACLAKRVDPSARRQSSRWSAGDRPVGELWADRDAGVTWLDVFLEVPGTIVSESRMRFREEMRSADIDINAYRIEVYQAVEGDR
jgi:4-amino-4-deoxy-L-arabinose transferase-like glycosyltransferase